MGRRGWTAEEADDFISEHGTGTTPMEVYNRERDEREDAAQVEGPGGCPEHPDATHWPGFGLAGGGYGTYKVCGAEGCAAIFDKEQWKDDEA